MREIWRVVSPFLTVLVIVTIIMSLANQKKEEKKYPHTWDYKHQREYFKNIEETDSILQINNLYKDEYN